MIVGLRQFSGNFRTLSVLVLVVSFLVLGSCPLRKAVLSLMNSTVTTEQGSPKHTSSLFPVVCVASESSFTNKMTFPEPQAENKASIFTAILLIAFWSVRSSLKSDSQLFRGGKLLTLSAKSVPLYLRNNTFII